LIVTQDSEALAREEFEAGWKNVEGWAPPRHADGRYVGVRIQGHWENFLTAWNASKPQAIETAAPTDPSALLYGERRINVSFRPRLSMYEVIRRIAFEEDRPIQSVCEDAIRCLPAYRERGGV
jgi:hypothetical protein